MKFTVSRSEFLKKLTPAAAITNARSPHPFGSCVLLRAQRDLVLESRSTISSVRARVMAEIAKPGTVAVPADDLLARVAAFPDGPIDVSYASNRLTLKAGARNYTLRTMSADGWPSFPDAPAKCSTVSGKALAEAIHAVSYAVGDDNGPAQFQGVVVSNDNATASDGKRIARVKVDARVETFVPALALPALKKILGETDVEVGTDDRSVYLKAGDVELSYLKPSVGAPPYDALMNYIVAKDGPEVSRGDLLGALNGITVDGISGGAPVVMTLNGGMLHLSHTSIEGEESTDEVAVLGGGKWTVAAEAKYLRDALKEMSDETVRVCVHEPEMQQPLVIRHSGGLATIARIDPKQCKRLQTKEAA